MKLGLMTGYSGSTLRIPLDIIKRAESLGFDSVWTAEAYGADAVTTATWILANTTKIRWALPLCRCRRALRPCVP